MISFSGTLIAQAVIDRELVWSVLSRRKGKYIYTACSDDLEDLLAGL